MKVLDKYEKISLAIKRSDLSQFEIADKLGIHKDSLSRSITNKTITDDRINDILKLIKMSSNDFWHTEIESTDTKLLSSSGIYTIQYYEHVDAICGIADYKNLEDQTSFPISIPGAREGDFCINAKGQSLSGIIESGTIIGLRPVKDYDLIVYGELYFVCTEAFERSKIIMPGSDKKHIILKSTDDERFPPVEIPKSKITALYKIWYKGELL